MEQSGRATIIRECSTEIGELLEYCLDTMWFTEATAEAVVEGLTEAAEDMIRGVLRVDSNLIVQACTWLAWDEEEQWRVAEAVAECEELLRAVSEFWDEA